MTPAEHYEKAEQHLGWANGNDGACFGGTVHLRFAQVHATLASCDPKLWPRVAGVESTPRRVRGM